jgi:hypothetical protein
MSTLFNFVTVRNPRTPTKAELGSGFIRYDENLDAPLIKASVAARAKGNTAVRRELLRAQGDDRVWADEAAMTAEAPALTAFAHWLSHRADTLTWAQLAKQRKASEVAVSSETLASLWDNLAVLTYAGGSPEVRELVVWALRATHLLAWDGKTDDNDLVRRLALATPLFPTALHGPTPLEKVVDDAPEPGGGDDGGGGGEGGDEDAGGVSATVRLRTLEDAHAELSRHLADARDEVRARSVAPPYVPVIGAAGCAEEPPPESREPVAPERLTLSKEHLKSVSEGTRAVFADLGIKEGQGLTSVLAKIVGEAETVGAQVARAGVGGQRVTQVGGAFLVQSTVTRDAGAGRETRQMMDQRTQHAYATFWGEKYGASDAEEGKRCRVRPLGIGDFRRVEQRICCNVPGEVAHIENVMEGETKERTTEHRTSVETFVSTISEEERTTERDSQTTDRFEMEKEVNRAMEFDLSVDIGVNVAAQYGPVKITADTKFATSLSTKESDKQATRYAKEVTDKTLERVVTKVREERSTRTIEEFRETNLHRLTADDHHVVGLYRWVEKKYEAKVVNYGKRLMFEFLVPEPAAFHLYAMTENAGDATAGLVKPIDPRTADTVTAFGRQPIKSHADITEANYAFWAATYDAVVEPPPALRVTTSKSYSRADMDQNVQFADSKTDLAMPAGFEADRFNAFFGLHSETHDGGPNWVTIAVGRQSRFATTGSGFSGFLNGEDDLVPVTVMGRTRMYGLNVEVECTRTPRSLVQWQQKTYRAILDGYAAKLGAYTTALAEAKSQAGVQIRGSNPLFNRQTESEELEKGCLRLLTSCTHLPSDAVQPGEYGYPEFDCCQALRDGSVVQFFEQLFEWRLLTYAFYPYFWGRKKNWVEIYHVDDVDPLFMSFLKAGFARVVVPVRPGYEGAALRYLADGSIWDGGSAPGIDDPMYVAIENDLKEPVSAVDPTIEPWEITVPTSLTVLQCESGCVPGTGLPCPCQDEVDDHGDHDDGDGDGGDGDHGGGGDHDDHGGGAGPDDNG